MKLLARKFYGHEFVAGDATKYIERFKLGPHDRVFLALRVSNREREENLDNQNSNLRNVVERARAEIVGRTAMAVSGFDPCWLIWGVNEAKRLRATVILAETTDRFVRNHHYHSSQRPELQASVEELEALARVADGMRLMTHLPPNASPSDVRSYQSKRGQHYKQRKGGRPRAYRPGYKKERYEKLVERVLELHQFDYSIRAIEDAVGVKRSTVQRWIMRNM